MEDSPQPKAPPPKRGKRVRLLLLSVTLVLVVAIYLPLRVNRANDHLRLALMASEAAGVRDALKGGADPDLTFATAATGPNRFDSLLDMVRLLFRRRMRPTKHTAKTALMYAAGSAEPEMVAALLKHGANVNTRLDNGYSALLYAASKHSPEIVAALLARGADIHAHTADNETPLLFAAQAGQTETVRLLLAKGEDIHEADHQVQTALSLATVNRHEETIQLLLAQGADARDLQGPPNANRFVRLSSLPAGATSVTINGRTMVVPAGQPLRLPAQPPPGLPPLVFAAKYGSPTLLKFLWEHTDSAAQQQDRWNLICSVVQSGQVEAVRFVLNQHIAVNPTNLPKADPRLSAPFGNGYDASKVYTPLHYAAALLDPEIARMLIAQGADVNAEDMFGTTPLLAAVSGSHLPTARLLIEHSANVQAVERHSGQNALMRGVHSVEMAQLLLDHGIDVNARDRNGRTALMQCYSPQVAALLVAHGADVNARDNQGNTPLLTAVRSLQKEYVTLMLKHGARVDNANAQGETPLSAARAMRSVPLIDLLTGAGAKR